MIWLLIVTCACWIGISFVVLCVFVFDRLRRRRLIARADAVYLRLRKQAVTVESEADLYHTLDRISRVQYARAFAAQVGKFPLGYEPEDL